MKSQNLFTVIMGLAVATATLVGGIALFWKAAPSYQPTASFTHHTLPAKDQLYSFGDDLGHQILLDLADPQTADFSLATASADRQFSSNQLDVCTHTGSSVVAPPVGTVSKLLVDDAAAPSLWEQSTAWLRSSLTDSYIIAIWSPSDEASEYVLVSGDGPTAPKVCSGLVDEDV